MSEKGKGATEQKILTGRSNSNSSSSSESFNSISPSKDTSNSSMAKVEELAVLLAELKAQIDSKAVPAALPLPIDKNPSGLNFKDTKNAMGVFPTKFNNTPTQNATDHMAQFELWCEATDNSSDDLKVKWFCFSILGEVSQWYKRTDFFNFEDLKTKFEKNFGKYRSTEDARIAFQSISLGSSEKASDYVRRIRNLASIALMTEADIKDQFFRGLSSKFTCVKQVRSLYSLEQAESYLQNIIDLAPEDKSVSFEEENMVVANEEHRRSRSSAKIPYKKEGSYNSKSGQESFRNKSSRRPYRSPSENSSRSRSRSQSRGRRPSTPNEAECFTCGGRGHFANVCPSRKGDTSRSKGNQRKRVQRPQQYYNVQESETEHEDIDSQLSKIKENTNFKKVVDIFGRPVIIPMPEPKPTLN